MMNAHHLLTMNYVYVRCSARSADMWSAPSWPGGLYSIYNKAIFTISLACRAASFCLRHPRQNFFPGGHHVWWNSHAGIGLRIWIAILAVLGQTYVILFKQSLCLCSCVMSLTNSLCVSLRLLVISSLWTMPPIARPSWPETFFEPERERSRSPRRVQPGTISPRTPPSLPPPTPNIPPHIGSMIPMTPPELLDPSPGTPESQQI